MVRVNVSVASLLDLVTTDNISCQTRARVSVCPTWPGRRWSVSTVHVDTLGTAIHVSARVGTNTRVHLDNI